MGPRSTTGDAPSCRSCRLFRRATLAFTLLTFTYIIHCGGTFLFTPRAWHTPTAGALEPGGVMQ